MEIVKIVVGIIWLALICVGIRVIIDSIKESRKI